MTKKKLPEFNPNWSDKKKFKYFEAKHENADFEDEEESKQKFEEFTKELNLKPKKEGHNFVAIVDKTKKSARWKRMRGK